MTYLLTQFGCDWICAQGDLNLGKKLGEGAYGRVYKAGYTPAASVKVCWAHWWVTLVGNWYRWQSGIVTASFLSSKQVLVQEHMLVCLLAFTNQVTQSAPGHHVFALVSYVSRASF